MYLRRFATPRHIAIARARCFATTSPALASKDAQHKDDLKPESNEYSKSGSDQKSAHAAEAFNPNKTRPESEFDSSKSGNEDPLAASPANHEFSKPKVATESGGSAGSPSETGSGGRQKSSGGGGAPKSGGKHSG